MADKIIATCMDRRLPNKIDSVAKGIHVSNAGCNVEAMRETLVGLALEDKGVKEIVAYLHTDCGAMGAVEDARAGNSGGYGELTRRSLLSRFDSRKWANRGELEFDINPQIQKEALGRVQEAVGRNISVKVELIDTGKISVPEIDHAEFALLVTKPSVASVPEIISRLGLRQFGTYVIQLLNANEALADIELTVNNLHVKRVVMHGLSAEEETAIRSAFPSLQL